MGDDAHPRRLDEPTLLAGYGMTPEQFDDLRRAAASEVTIEQRLDRQARFHPIRLAGDYTAAQLARVTSRERERE